MSIGFYYHSEALQEPGGATLVPPYLGRFLDTLTLCYEQVTVFLHQKPDEAAAGRCTYCCSSPNLSVHLLPPKGSPASRLLRSPGYMRAVAPWRDKLDSLILRVPTPLAWFIWHALGRPPTGLLVVGDLVESVTRTQLPLQKKALGFALAHLDLWLLKMVARDSIVAANGPELAQKWRRMGPAFEVSTGTLYANELRCRDDHFKRACIRLLFVGRDSREKRVEDLIEAAAQIAEQEAVLVEIAGIERDSLYGCELAALATARGIGDNVHFYGFIDLASDLLRLYDQSDVMVLPTRWEGIPRVLWEAMGRGCLVVTTAVGGIPLVTRDERECLHVPVGRPDLIVAAINRLERDADLRRRLVAAGLEQARRHTIEYTVAELARTLAEADPAFHRALLDSRRIAALGEATSHAA